MLQLSVAIGLHLSRQRCHPLRRGQWSGVTDKFDNCVAGVCRKPVTSVDCVRKRAEQTLSAQLEMFPGPAAFCGGVLLRTLFPSASVTMSVESCVLCMPNILVDYDLGPQSGCRTSSVVWM